MEDIQNATLAGGVAVGSSSDLVVGPWASLLIGMVAGLVSTVGFARLKGYLWNKIGLHDSCGVLNLHGLPGIIGAIGGAISATQATEILYGVNIGNVFPMRADGARSANVQGG